MVKKLTVRNLLENVTEIKNEKKEYWLMIPENITDWNEDTQCVLATSDECEAFEDHYNEFHNSEEKIISFITSISIDDVEDILSNLYQQIKNPKLNQKLDALVYYINNDAFIELSS